MKRVIAVITIGAALLLGTKAQPYVQYYERYFATNYSRYAEPLGFQENAGMDTGLSCEEVIMGHPMTCVGDTFGHPVWAPSNLPKGDVVILIHQDRTKEEIDGKVMHFRRVFRYQQK